MKLKEIIRCIDINPYYVNSDSQREQLKMLNGGRDLYDGGIANAYIYIPYSEELEKVLSNEEMYPFEYRCSVHGGITYGGTIDGISKYHCPYSGVISNDKYNAKYIVVGWDTNHSDDTPESWTYQSIISENEKLARQILDVINKELNKLNKKQL